MPVPTRQVNRDITQGEVKMKKLVTLAFTFIIAVALVVVASAQTTKPAKTAAKPAPKTVKFLGKGDGLHTCPVTGE